MPSHRLARSLLLILVLALCTLPFLAATADESVTPRTALEAEVRATETAFAKSMADRDRDAFAGFLDEETVFFSADQALQGAEVVTQAWSRFFEGEAAPFSWAPDVVSVLESGKLALSSGSVFSPTGERIGTFNSVWRLNENGAWKVVFDRGCPVCECP